MTSRLNRPARRSVPAPAPAPARQSAPPPVHQSAPLPAPVRHSSPPAHRSPLAHRWAFTATGCRWAVSTRRPLPEGLRRLIGERINAFEGVWSRFRPDSLVSRAAAGALPPDDDGAVVLDLPDGSGRLLDLYDALHRATGGRLDPLVGADLVELGYDPRYSFVVRDGAARRLGVTSGRGAWADLATHEGDRLRLGRAALIDVGAAGKGLLADLVGAWLEQEGVEEYLVDGSGDLLVRCSEPLRLGLEEPGSTEEDPRVVGVVELARGALCASGTARRTWGPGLHHLLDAVTGLPVGGARAVIASWAVAGDCMSADALATALFLAEPQALAEAGFAYEFALLRADGSAAISRGLPGGLFTA